MALRGGLPLDSRENNKSKECGTQIQRVWDLLSFGGYFLVATKITCRQMWCYTKKTPYVNIPWVVPPPSNCGK